MIVQPFGVALRLENDQLLVCGRSEGDDGALDGTLDGAPISVALTRRDEAELPLLRRRFRWIMD